MPLLELPLATTTARPPADVRRFLREASRRIRRVQRAEQIPAFAPSDFGAVYGALCEVEGAGELPGRWFCEWGSGLGVVSCLAAMVGLGAWGIETEPALVRAARRLADDFGLGVEFVCGSFIPAGARRELLVGREFAWLGTEGRCGHEALGISLDEFDVIYAYPWPDEESLVEQLFEGHARPGALLLTYHVDRGLRLRRKDGRGAPGG
jgi:hypothetical protein